MTNKEKAIALITTFTTGDTEKSTWANQNGKFGNEAILVR